MKEIQVEIRPEQARLLTKKKAEADAAQATYQAAVDAVFAGLLKGKSVVKGWTSEGAVTVQVQESEEE